MQAAETCDRRPLWSAARTRSSSNGRASVFQTDDAGSIPAGRSGCKPRFDSVQDLRVLSCWSQAHPIPERQVRILPDLDGPWLTGRPLECRAGTWLRSSVWLERRPVEADVAGSNPVEVADVFISPKRLRLRGGPGAAFPDKKITSPRRLAAQDTGLSLRQREFESRRGYEECVVQPPKERGTEPPQGGRSQHTPSRVGRCRWNPCRTLRLHPSLGVWRNWQRVGLWSRRLQVRPLPPLPAVLSSFPSG